MNDAIVNAVAAHFRTFGGCKANPGNPVSVALADRPPQFAAGVDVAAVVEFIANEIGAAVSADNPSDSVDALTQAESFIAGFENDESQAGVADILAGLRAAIARERAKPDMLGALEFALGVLNWRDESPAELLAQASDAAEIIEAAITAATGISPRDAALAAIAEAEGRSNG